MTREAEPLAAWQLERYRLGELPPAEAEAVRAALAADPALRERMAGLERSDHEILAARSPRVAAAAIRARLREDERAEPRWWTLPRAAAAGLATLVVAGIALGPGSRSRELSIPRPDAVRVKGLQPHLLVFRQTPAGPEALGDGALARPDDVVQLRYQSAGQRYGVIVSVDGRGTVTVHLPAGAPRAGRLKAGGPVALASAYRLDDAPALERFYFVTSARPFPVAVVTEAARQGAGGGAVGSPARLPLPPGLQQSSFTLRKEATR